MCTKITKENWMVFVKNPENYKLVKTNNPTIQESCDPNNCVNCDGIDCCDCIFLGEYELIENIVREEECDGCNHIYVNAECRNCGNAENIPAVTNNLYCRIYNMLVNRKMGCAEFIHINPDMVVTINDIPKGEE